MLVCPMSLWILRPLVESNLPGIFKRCGEVGLPLLHVVSEPHETFCAFKPPKEDS